MIAYRSEIERIIPSLRQVGRALVESHRADIADDLVHDVLDEALAHERHWTVGEVEGRMYARLIAANRLRLRTELGERRTQPGGGSRSDTATPGRTASTPPHSADYGVDALALCDREALFLVVLARLDYAKAADVLGIPASTLIARLIRARDGLGTSMWSASAAPKQSMRPLRPTHLRLVKS